MKTALRSLWPYGVVLLLGSAVLLPALGGHGFWDPWEPKYAESAREMNERGSWMVPYYRDDVRLTKPILVYWGILAGSFVFGLDEFGARFGGVAFALTGMLLTLYAVAALRGRQAGLIAAAVLATLPYFVLQARQAMPDIYLSTGIGAALLFLALALFGPERRRTLHWIVSFAGVAVAILAKGPMIVGAIYGVTLAIAAVCHVDWQRLVAPAHRVATIATAAGAAVATAASALAIWLGFFFATSPEWWSYREDKRAELGELQARIAETLGGSKTAIVLGSYLLLIAAGFALWRLATRYLQRPGLWPGRQATLREIGRRTLLCAGVLAVVAGPWHVAIVIDQGHGYFTDFIIKHNVHRAAETVNRSGVSDYYLETLLFGFFPWIGFLPIGLALLVDWRGGTIWRRHGAELLLIVAVVVIFVTFSSPATKFSHYLMPIVFPAAALIGMTIDRILESRGAGTRLAWLFAAAVCALPVLDLLRPEGIRDMVATFTVKNFVPGILEPHGYWRGTLYALVAVTGAGVLWRSRAVVAAMVLASALVLNFTTTSFIPALSADKTMKHLCETWQRVGGPDAPIGLHGKTKHGAFFYTKNRIEVLRSRGRFVRFMEPSRPAYCIIEMADYSKLRRAYTAMFTDGDLHVLDDSHFRFVLIGNRPLLSDDEPG